MRLSSRPSGDRLLLIVLLCLAVLPKALVPVGWMPSAEGLVVCGGWLPAPEVEAPPALHGEHHGGHHEAAPAPHHQGDDEDDASHDQSSQPCAFAGAALALDGVEGPELAALLPFTTPAAPPATTYTTGRGLAAPPPPATGPPLLT